LSAAPFLGGSEGSKKKQRTRQCERNFHALYGSERIKKSVREKINTIMRIASVRLRFVSHNSGGGK
jgi:hypothetical protein